MSKPKHMPWISSYLMVQDVEKARNFYRDVFGFEETDEVVHDENKIMVHTAMRYHDGVVMMGLEGTLGKESKAPASSGVKSPMNLYVYCDDVDAFFTKAVAAGAKSIEEPVDMFWGDRMCVVVDPDGYHWSFASYKGS